MKSAQRNSACSRLARPLLVRNKAARRIRSAWQDQDGKTERGDGEDRAALTSLIKKTERTAPFPLSPSPPGQRCQAVLPDYCHERDSLGATRLLPPTCYPWLYGAGTPYSNQYARCDPTARYRARCPRTCPYL